MIKLYYRKGCGSSRKALEWFEHYNVEVELINIIDITSSDLLEMLPLTSQGLEELMKHPRFSSRKNKTRYNELLNAPFKEAVLYLSNNPEFLRTPIIYDRSKISVGYHLEEIRRFLPPIYREQSRKIKL